MALHSTLGPGFNALLPGLLPDVGQYGWKLCSIISCHEREGPHARPPSVGAFCKMQWLPASSLCSGFALHAWFK